MKALLLLWLAMPLIAADPIVAGLEEAVDFGTAQRAQVAGVKVASKTGSVRTVFGAPFAGRILQAYRAGKL